MNNHDFVGFIPKRMDIAESIMFHFPQNVAFGKFGRKDGHNVFGTALYEPELDTFEQEGEKYSMKYRNAYGGDCWLRVIYDDEKKNWTGEKFVNGKSAWISFGAKWDMFFVHFTMPGLANGERCVFEEIPSKISE